MPATKNKKRQLPIREMDPDSLLSANDAAKLMRFQPQTLAVQRCEGRGLPYLKVGRSVRYKVADILEYLDGCAAESED